MKGRSDLPKMRSTRNISKVNYVAYKNRNHVLANYALFRGYRDLLLHWKTLQKAKIYGGKRSLLEPNKFELSFSSFISTFFCIDNIYLVKSN